MPSPGWIRATIALAAALMLLLSLITGDSIDQEGLRWLGGVISAVILAVLAFDRWLWRAPGIRRVCETLGHPCIHGTWHGDLIYQRDGDGNPGTTAIYLAVCQTFSTVSVRCYFPNTGAESWSLTASLLKNDHRHDLHYIFHQQAPAPGRHLNRPTDGACELAVAGRPVRELVGSYYAERGGKGEIDAREYSPRLAGSLAEAKGLALSLRPTRP
jgi:hypothetical protein